MRVGDLHIENYRCLKQVGLTVDPSSPVLIVVGRNGSGKTTLLDAIDLLLGDSNPQRRDITDNEFMNPKKHVNMSFSLYEIADLVLQMYRSSSESTQDDLFPDAPFTPPSRVTYSIDFPNPGPYSQNPSTSVLPATIRHSDEALRSSAARVFYVRSERETELRLPQDPRRWWGKFLRDVVASLPHNKKEELKGLLSDVDKLVNELVSPGKERIAASLRSIQSFSDFELTVTPQDEVEDVADHLVPTFTATHGGTKRKVTLRKECSGARALVFLASFVELISRVSTQRASVLLVDEPELFLHPHAIRSVRDMLREAMTKLAGALVVLVTHSPLMVARMPSRTIVRLGYSGDGYLGYQVPDSVANELDAAFPDGIPVQLADALFSDGAVLVEGATDTIVFSGLGRLLSGDTANAWDVANISISPVHGKDKKFEAATRLLRWLGIPVHCIGDKGTHDILEAIGKKDPKAPAPFSFSELAEGELEDYYDLKLLVKELAFDERCLLSVSSIVKKKDALKKLGINTSVAADAMTRIWLRTGDSPLLEQCRLAMEKLTRSHG